MSSNLSMLSSQMSYSPIQTALISTSVSFLFIIIVAGNCLVLIAISSDYRLKNVQNWFLSSLAVADLLLGLLILPFSLFNQLFGRWIFGRLMCSLWLAIDVLLCTASIMHLCLISIDRYYSVIRPIQYKTSSTPSRVMTMIAAAWIISGCICLPPLFGWGRPILSLKNTASNLTSATMKKLSFNKVSTSTGTCELNQNTSYVLYSTIGSFYIPLLVIILVYVQVYRQAKMRTNRQMMHRPYPKLTKEPKQKRSTHRSPRKYPAIAYQYSQTDSCVVPDEFEELSTVSNINNYNCTVYESNIEEVPDQTKDVTEAEDSNDSSNNVVTNSLTVNSRLRSKSIFSKLAMRKSKLIRHRERRTIVVLGVVVGAFIVCWLPFFTSYLIVIFCRCMNMQLFNFFFWLGYCNSALNPIIYTVYNRDFRKAFQKLLSFNTAPTWKNTATNYNCKHSKSG